MTDSRTMPDTAPDASASPREPLVARWAAYADWYATAVRTQAAVRGAMRTADNPALHDRAYPHVGRWSRNRDDTDALLAASAIIARTGVRHHPGVNIGDAARMLANTPRAMSRDSLNTMIGQMYRSPIRVAGRTLETILHQAADHRIGVDYTALIAAFRYWDTNPYARTPQRRRLLDNYYTEPFHTP